MTREGHEEILNLPLGGSLRRQGDPNEGPRAGCSKRGEGRLAKRLDTLAAGYYSVTTLYHFGGPP